MQEDNGYQPLTPASLHTNVHLYLHVHTHMYTQANEDK